MCTSFRRCDGHTRKIGFLTFVVCMWEERAELRLVGLFRWFPSHGRSSTGEGSFCRYGATSFVSQLIE